MNSDPDPRRFHGFQSLKGPDEVILGAELDDLSFAVKFPRGEAPRDGELPEILQDAGKEFNHFAAVRGWLPGYSEGNIESDTEIVTDGGQEEIDAIRQDVSEVYVRLDKLRERAEDSVLPDGVAAGLGDAMADLDDVRELFDRHEEAHDELVADGGHPASLGSALKRAQAIFDGSLEHIPDGQLELLEEHGADIEGLDNEQTSSRLEHLQRLHL